MDLNAGNVGGRGTLFVISAPSGAGKTTLVRGLLARHPEVVFSISYTTRPPRSGETDGRDYHFVDRDRFAAMVAAGEFLEHAEVFGNFYGTRRSQVDVSLAAGHSVLLEIDWQGARQVRRNAPDCRTVFIVPPSIDELARRLRDRGTDADEVIRRRLAAALDDLSHWQEFDFLVVNDELDSALAALADIVAGRGDASSSTAAGPRDTVKRLLAG